MNIVIFGGSGFLGRALAAQLATAGHSLVIATRNRETANESKMLPTLRVEVIDANSDADLARVVRGADAVINLIGRLHEKKRCDFNRTHVELTQRLVDTCGANAVSRFVQVSALGAAADAPSNYLQSRFAGEEVVRGSKLNWTIFAPSVIFGAGDSFVLMFANILKLTPPFVPLFMPKTSAKFQPVWVDDVARAITAALGNGGTVGQRYELGGPKVYTLKEIVKHAGARLGRDPCVLPMPGPLGTLQATALEFVPGGPLMSRDNLRSMSVDNVTQSPWPSFAAPAPTAMDVITPQYVGDMADRFAGYRRT